jgi:hypothetical protein
MNYNTTDFHAIVAEVIPKVVTHLVAHDLGMYLRDEIALKYGTTMKRKGV